MCYYSSHQRLALLKYRWKYLADYFEFKVARSLKDPSLETWKESKAFNIGKRKIETDSFVYVKTTMKKVTWYTFSDRWSVSRISRYNRPNEEKKIFETNVNNEWYGTIMEYFIYKYLTQRSSLGQWDCHEKDVRVI